MGFPVDFPVDFLIFMGFPVDFPIFPSTNPFRIFSGSQYWSIPSSILAAPGMESFSTDLLELG